MLTGCFHTTGADPGFFKGGSQAKAMVICINYIIYIIIHIIILNEVHCNLPKPIDA